jgi:cytochrome c2
MTPPVVKSCLKSAAVAAILQTVIWRDRIWGAFTDDAQVPYQLFPYSDALKKAQITWNADTLDRWLTDPEQLVPNTDMAFRVQKADERNEIIQYLQQLSGK